MPSKKSQCTRAKYQRIIERHEFAEALEKNKQNIADNPQIYVQRQAIVEHPFGTMKRQWGFDHIMTKKRKEKSICRCWTYLYCLQFKKNYKYYRCG